MSIMEEMAMTNVKTTAVLAMISEVARTLRKNAGRQTTKFYSNVNEE